VRLLAADHTCRVDVAQLDSPAQSRADGLSIFILRPTQIGEPLQERPRPGVDFLAAILDHAPDAVAALDECGFVTYANPALERLVGTPPAEIINRPVAELLTGESAFCEITANLEPGGEIQGDLKLRNRWISISSRPLHLPDRSAAGSVSFLRDVTERRAMQEALEHKNAELESYVHTVSHDLRSPLVSMLGFEKLLRQDYGPLLDETGRHFLDRIEQAGRTMQGLIQDLLELSQIGASGETRTLVDPRSVLLQLQAELKPLLDERDIDLRLPDSPPLVLCDRTRLYQVFSNLIGNAVDHMGERKDACIRVDIVSRADHHRICVRDNGVGIASSDHERIFQVFQSLGRRASGRRTTGMGLTIVKKIAAVNGGSVWVDSNPGEGAAFYLTLPN
jgi:PAS domain S-box-containing protein